MVRVVARVEVVVVQRAVQPVVDVLHGAHVHEEHDEQPGDRGGRRSCTGGGDDGFEGRGDEQREVAAEQKVVIPVRRGWEEGDQGEEGPS